MQQDNRIQALRECLSDAITQAFQSLSDDQVLRLVKDAYQAEPVELLRKAA